MNVLPAPDWLSTAMLPPCASTSVLAIDSPRPKPGVERLVSNISKRFLVDENQPLTEGVAEAMASGAIAGFAMGGGMAVAFGKEGDSQAKKLLTDDQDVTSEDILLGTD